MAVVAGVLAAVGQAPSRGTGGYYTGWKRALVSGEDGGDARGRGSGDCELVGRDARDGLGVRNCFGGCEGNGAKGRFRFGRRFLRLSFSD